jgi:hypothetical protein
MRRALILLAVLGCGTKVVDLEPMDAEPEKVAACGIQVLSDELRCVYCKGTTVEQRACLKCESSYPGSGCRLCMWSDDPSLVCKQCTDANGKTLPDDCDHLRRELPQTSP